MTTLDSVIYSAVRETMLDSEEYLGRMEWAWTFCTVHYTAESTESVEFSLLDKVICGILQIDGTLSWVKIGEILGLNVVQDVRNHRYIDFAERELLQEALTELANFGMIETGGTKFDACRLTPLGKEYAAAGKKFKITENKPFKLFFDPLSGEHIGAKERFEYLRTKASPKTINATVFSDENVIRAIAAVQAPQMHNPAPDQLRTFRKPVLQRVELSDLKLQLGVVRDKISGFMRVLLYDRQNKQIDPFFTQTANENQGLKNKILQDFLEHKSQEDVVGLVDVLPKSETIDTEHFWVTFASNFSTKCTETYLLFRSVDDIMLKQVSILLHQVTPKQCVFLVLPIAEDKAMRDACYEIEQMTWGKPNLFVINGHKLNSNTVIFREPETDFYFLEKKKTVVIEAENIGNSAENNAENNVVNNLSQACFSLSRKVISRELRVPVVGNTLVGRKLFIDVLWRGLVEDTLALLNEPLPERVNRAVLKRYADCDLRLRFLDNGACNWFGIKESKNTQIYRLAALHLTQLANEVTVIEQKLPAEDDFSDPALRRLTRLRSEVEALIADCLADELYNEVRENLKTLLEKITASESHLRDRILVKTYVIDTNAFIDQPDILSLIDLKHQIIVSSRVLDELDKLKTDETLKKAASRAIGNIRREQKKREKEKRNPIVFRNGNINLLPSDFNQRTNDNFILSVALTAQYKEENVVLLTSDNGLRLKADAVNIFHTSLSDFLDALPTKPKQNKYQR